MANIEFMHIGITVTDIEKSSAFYEKYFGFKSLRSVRFDENFIGDAPALYRQPAGVYSDMRMLQSDYGVTLELFQFSNVEKSELYQWQKSGYHHLAFKVESIPALYEQMKADGIEFFFEPKKRGNSDAHWIFFQDPDGNMIELWD
ncbi:MAG: VOC family protein [Peptococcaceae bacterium]|jgi:catechol 2,3-dioxygenase-like lactoylglutathione lyase family enzyme|nr:VOC family protein [Peptococcaceae bacterium]